VLLPLALLAPASAAPFVGASAAAVLDATDGCTVTRAWVWAGEDLQGDSAVRLFGAVWDACRQRKVAHFSGEAAGVAFTVGRKGLTLDADVPVETVDVRTRRTTPGTMILSVDWEPAREGGRADSLGFDWGTWRVSYPAGASFWPAVSAGRLDGAELRAVWAYTFGSRMGEVDSSRP
jgi:hypothetical protein